MHFGRHTVSLIRLAEQHGIPALELRTLIKERIDEVRRKRNKAIRAATEEKQCPECFLSYSRRSPGCERHARRDQDRINYNNSKRRKRIETLPFCTWDGNNKPCPYRARHEVNGMPVCGIHLRAATGIKARPYKDYICSSCGARYEESAGNAECRDCRQRAHKRHHAEKRRNGFK